jgi:exodeoxyribonuclease VII small subunit
VRASKLAVWALAQWPQSRSFEPTALAAGLCFSTFYNFGPTLTRTAHTTTGRFELSVKQTVYGNSRLAKKVRKKTKVSEESSFSEAQVEDQPVVVLPFEESLGELQQIVNQLEDGSLPLDDSMEQFERGIKLLKDCYRVLENAEQQIEILTQVDANGDIHTTPFESTATFDVEANDTTPKEKPKGKPDKLF